MIHLTYFVKSANIYSAYQASILGDMGFSGEQCLLQLLQLIAGSKRFFILQFFCVMAGPNLASCFSKVFIWAS